MVFIAGDTLRHQPMVAGHMAVPQFRGPITYCVLQWCHPMLTGTQRRTSYSTRMITLYGDHVIKLDSGPRNYHPWTRPLYRTKAEAWQSGNPGCLFPMELPNPR